VILPKELARNLSDISPLVLVKAVSAGIHVVDPFTGEVSHTACYVTSQPSTLLSILSSCSFPALFKLYMSI
jgi:hypothetical protein